MVLQQANVVGMNPWLTTFRREAVNAAVYNLPPSIAAEFENLVDHVGPLNRWPINVAEAIVSSHLTYLSRFQLTLFLLGNRVPPSLFVSFFLKRNMLRDISARRHVAGLLLAHKSGKLEADGKTAWILGAVDGAGNDLIDKNQVIATPRFAAEEPQYWDEAIKKLNSVDADAVLAQEEWLKLETNAILPHRMPASSGAATGPIFGSNKVFNNMDMLSELAANSTPIASPLRDVE